MSEDNKNNQTDEEQPKKKPFTPEFPNDNANWRPATKAVRSGRLSSQYQESSEALFLNSGFYYDDAETAESRFSGEQPGFVYSRYLNPTLAMLERRLVSLEEGAEAACVVASGMAAVFASMMCQLRAGDHIVASKVLFGSCFYIISEILPRLGFEVSFVAGDNLDEWRQAIKHNTKCIFIETPANPLLGLVDIAAVAEIAHQQSGDASVIVDNVFATPLGQSPLLLGADLVTYSTTKHLDGQGRTLGGAVLGKKEFIDDILLPFHRHTGPALSPFNAWVILKSLETFALRYNQHVANAEYLANLLENDSRINGKINKVLYPGLPSHPNYDIAQKQMKDGGALIAFELAGGKESAFRVMNNLNIIDISNNLGDAKSLITHPATTTHSNIKAEERNQLGITDGIVRLSVGLEDKEDLAEDLINAISNG